MLGVNSRIGTRAGARRAHTDHRVEEVLAATQSLLDLDRADVPALRATGASFIGLLDVDSGVIAMGHSFGGGTVLTAASRRPGLFRAVVAHEPALDWMPDDAREALFPRDLFDDADVGYDGGTGGILTSPLHDAKRGRQEDGEEKEASPTPTPTPFASTSSSSRRNSCLHNVDMLFLYSDEWSQKVSVVLGFGNTIQTSVSANKVYPWRSQSTVATKRHSYRSDIFSTATTQCLHFDHFTFYP